MKSKFRQFLVRVFLCSILAWIDVPVGNAITIQFPPTSQGTFDFISGLLCYISTGLGTTSPSLNTCLSSSAAIIDNSELPDAISQSLSQFATQANIRPQELLDWWDQVQPLTISMRQQLPPIADTLAEFRAVTGYREWAREILTLSIIKRRTRVIYRSPATVLPRISVAETLNTQSGDITAAVRETEVAIERNDGSGSSDFYSYNELGQLSRLSEFPSGPRPVPSACLSCHFQRQDRIFHLEGAL